MFLLWIVAGVGAAAGVLGWLAARRAARQVATLTQAYWELRYEQGRLKALLTPAHDGDDRTGADEPSSSGDTAFVPIATLKRR